MSAYFAERKIKNIKLEKIFLTWICLLAEDQSNKILFQHDEI